MKPKIVRASYRWREWPNATPSAQEVEHLFAVSTPGDKEFPNQVAEWSADGWKDLAGEKLDGVTYWASLPATPEQLAAEYKSGEEPPKPEEKKEDLKLV